MTTLLILLVVWLAFPDQVVGIVCRAIDATKARWSKKD